MTHSFIPRMRDFFMGKNTAHNIVPQMKATDLGNGNAEVILYGDIVSNEPLDFFGQPIDMQVICPKQVVKELEKIKDADSITVRLNSGGGDAFAGIAIYDALKALDAHITVRIEGLAASAASFIACAGDEVIVNTGTTFMVHEPRVGVCGLYSVDELNKAANLCESVIKSAVNVYAAKTGRDADDLTEMIANETWMVGQEIIDAGFADTMEDSDSADEVVYDSSRQIITACGLEHDASMFGAVPSAFTPNSPQQHADAADMAVPADAPVQEPQVAAEKEKEVRMETVEELTNAYPDLVNEIKQSAAAAERERICAIDQIAGQIGADAATAAKYGEVLMTAEQAAFAAMKEREEVAQKTADEFLVNSAADTADSGAEEIEAEPNDGTAEVDAEKEDQAFAALVNSIVSNMNGKAGC